MGFSQNTIGVLLMLMLDFFFTFIDWINQNVFCKLYNRCFGKMV